MLLKYSKQDSLILKTRLIGHDGTWLKLRSLKWQDVRLETTDLFKTCLKNRIKQQQEEEKKPN